MAERKRKITDKKRPAYKLPRVKSESEDDDLKKVKARTIKELKESRLNDKDWLDKELDKNLKNQK